MRCTPGSCVAPSLMSTLCIPSLSGSPLFRHPRVLHTPHVAGITGPTESLTTRRAVRTALDLLQTAFLKATTS